MAREQVTKEALRERIIKRGLPSEMTDLVDRLPDAALQDLSIHLDLLDRALDANEEYHLPSVTEELIRRLWLWMRLRAADTLTTRMWANFLHTMREDELCRASRLAEKVVY